MNNLQIAKFQGPFCQFDALQIKSCSPIKDIESFIWIEKNGQKIVCAQDVGVDIFL
jgi:hypothetical protein